MRLPTCKKTIKLPFFYCVSIKIKIKSLTTPDMIMNESCVSTSHPPAKKKNRIVTISTLSFSCPPMMSKSTADASLFTHVLQSLQCNCTACAAVQGPKQKRQSERILNPGAPASSSSKKPHDRSMFDQVIQKDKNDLGCLASLLVEQARGFTVSVEVQS